MREPVPLSSVRTPRSRGFLISLIAVAALFLVGAAPAAARVLLVSQHHGRGELSRWHHSRFRFDTIQAAVDAARPGDWILIAPGDYHERGDYTTHKPSDEAGAGVLITTPSIHLRGLDRNGVVVDGTKPGSPRCSSAAADQDFGPQGPDGTAWAATASRYSRRAA